MTDYYKSMFEQAVRTLAAIDEALGIGDDGCGDPEQTLGAIAVLKQKVGAARRRKHMSWVKAEIPPEMKTSEWWPESVPVLVYLADGTMRVATYEHINEDSAPCWYSADIERWMLETVTHWMPLPPAPEDGCDCETPNVI